ncbi:MAG TPA: 6-carboxytetrahydropterin synthase [Thermoanaerobaculia bacterium]|jgi:6-pyruvoyltetrahydropterin/6-carboxytetrahydropterin synthase
MTITLERRYRFSASHLYRRPDWSEAENRARFGKCANLPGHGHNYRLYVTVGGEIDPATGFVVDLGALDALVQERVIERLDHQHLNAALPEFGEGKEIPSSESIVRWIHGQLADRLPTGSRLVRLRLEEDEDLAAEWTAGAG